MKEFKKLKNLATILVILITAVFLAKTLLKYYEPTKYDLSSIPAYKIILAACFFLGYFYMRAISWRYLTQYLGESVSKTSSLTIWFFSEALRYIPGNIWSFASRAYLARQKQISKEVSFLILPIEIIIVTTTTTILSSYAIIKTLEKLQVNLIFYILIFTSLIVTLVLLLSHKIILRVLKKILLQKLVLKALPTALILQFLSWSLYSTGYIILIDFAGIQDLALLFSSTLLAWLIGYLTIVSPMGLGVRESTFILLIGPQIGLSQAAVIALLARVILIVTELINLTFWVSLKRRT